MTFRYPILNALILSMLLGGCGMVYTNIHVPRAYRSATPADVKSEKNDPLATGKACSRSLLFMFAWGDAGYAAATQNALKGEQDKILYDVKSDTHVKSILGLYTKVCTVVTGKVAQQ